jgi:16S rRNA (cytosine967-C5)-methyltransferase
MNARTIAFKVLLQVERASAYLNVALDAALRSAGALPREEAALATELTYGVARRALALDATVAEYSRRSVSKLEPGVLVLLRLGAYQLLYLRIPEHAAVDATVELAKQQGFTRAAGLVNAILRKIALERRVPLPADPLERLSVSESHPLWLVRRWAARFGEEQAAALCHANNAPAPVCVRVNATRATREEAIAALAGDGVRALPTRLSPLGLTLEAPGPLPALAAFRRGLIQVQDEAAQLVGHLCSVRPGMRVLDACAAPGGKVCHIAEQLRGDGEVFAIDVHPRKLERIEEEARRLGVERCMRLRAADASRPLPLEEGSFDRVLLDAPCSGLGTLRRHPELRYRRLEEDIQRLAQVQRSLAENLLRYIKPGGALVYAVCSTEPEEGPEQARWLAGEGFTIVDPEEDKLVPWVEVKQAEGIATFPHRHHTDGFFAVKLKRSS